MTSSRPQAEIPAASGPGSSAKKDDAREPPMSGDPKYDDITRIGRCREVDVKPISRSALKSDPESVDSQSVASASQQRTLSPSRESAMSVPENKSARKCSNDVINDDLQTEGVRKEDERRSQIVDDVDRTASDSEGTNEEDRSVLKRDRRQPPPPPPPTVRSRQTPDDSEEEGSWGRQADGGAESDDEPRGRRWEELGRKRSFQEAVSCRKGSSSSESSDRNSEGGVSLKRTRRSDGNSDSRHESGHGMKPRGARKDDRSDSDEGRGFKSRRRSWREDCDRGPDPERRGDPGRRQSDEFHEHDYRSNRMPYEERYEDRHRDHADRGRRHGPSARDEIRYVYDRGRGRGDGRDLGRGGSWRDRSWREGRGARREGMGRWGYDRHEGPYRPGGRDRDPWGRNDWRRDDRQYRRHEEYSRRQDEPRGERMGETDKGGEGDGLTEAEKAERDDLTVLVANIPLRATEEDLRSLFQFSTGSVRDVRLIRDSRSGQSKGIGFVEFRDSAAVLRSLALTNQSLMGQPLRIMPSHAERNRAARTAKAQMQVSGPTQIYVSGLVGELASLSADEVRLLFSPFGKITGLDVPQDAYTRRNKGFAIITFAQPAQARDAVAAMHNFELGTTETYTLRVAFAARSGGPMDPMDPYPNADSSDPKRPPSDDHMSSPSSQSFPPHTQSTKASGATSEKVNSGLNPGAGQRIPGHNPSINDPGRQAHEEAENEATSEVVKVSFKCRGRPCKEGEDDTGKGKEARTKGQETDDDIMEVFDLIRDECCQYGVIIDDLENAEGSCLQVRFAKKEEAEAAVSALRKASMEGGEGSSLGGRVEPLTADFVDPVEYTRCRARKGTQV